MIQDDLIAEFWECAPYSAVPLPEAKLQRLIELCRNLKSF
jgi:hypothetical protein